MDVRSSGRCVEVMSNCVSDCQPSLFAQHSQLFSVWQVLCAGRVTLEQRSVLPWANRVARLPLLGDSPPS
jgi:hypothetical protein